MNPRLIEGMTYDIKEYNTINYSVPYRDLFVNYTNTFLNSGSNFCLILHELT